MTIKKMSTKKRTHSEDDKHACHTKKNKQTCTAAGAYCDYSYLSGCHTSEAVLNEISRLVDKQARDVIAGETILADKNELMQKYEPRAILKDVARTYGFNKKDAEFLEKLADNNEINTESYYALLRFIGQNYKSMKNGFSHESILKGINSGVPMAVQVLYFDSLKKNLKNWNNKQILAASLGVMAVGALLVMGGKSIKDSPAFSDLMAYVYSKEGFKSVTDENAKLKTLVETNKIELQTFIKKTEQLARENNSLQPNWWSQWGYTLKWNTATLFGAILSIFSASSVAVMSAKINRACPKNFPDMCSDFSRGAYNNNYPDYKEKDQNLFEVCRNMKCFNQEL